MTHDRSSCASAATRRRARLRLHARYRRLSKVLGVLIELVSVASNGDTRFSRQLSATFFCSQQDMNWRHSRDILPLPIADSALPLPCVAGSACCTQMCKLVNASVAGLNYLYSNFMCVQPRARGTNNQREVLIGLATRWWHIALHLDAAGPLGEISDAFQAVVSKNKGSPAVPLRAEIVDMPEKCANVDPMPFLPIDIKQAISEPQTLFPGEKNEVTEHVEEPSFRGGARAEYVMLLRRQARAGKIVFSSSFRHAAEVFTVRKGDTGRQREVWNGGPLSQITAVPPRPPCLVTPCALSTLECSDDLPLWLSTRDGQSFFDQLQIPKEIRDFVGRPSVSAFELCEADFKGAVHENQGPMTLDEFKSYCVDGCTAGVPSDSKVWPLAMAWPMGHSWSSAIAQYTMVGTCTQAGASSDQFLGDEMELTNPSKPSVAVATDDINLLERASRFHGPEGESLLHKLDAVWHEVGIKEKREKHIDRQLTGSMLGMHLVRGTHLLPKASRLHLVVQSLLGILRHPFTTPADFQCYLGSLQWLMLANRPTLSIFTAVYAFSQRLPTFKPQRLPSDVIDELKILATLLCTLVLDLRRDWAPYLFACDGAPTFGYGGCRAAASPSAVREVARRAAHYPHRMIPREGITECTNQQDTHVLPCKCSDFRSIFSVKCQASLHASRVEMGALVLTLRNATRSSKNHGKRLTILTDSLSVLFCVRKGRSSAPNLVPGMRMVAALTLACDLKLHLAYIPSRWNPADDESRGFARRSRGSHGNVHARENRLGQRLHELNRSFRKLRANGFLDFLEPRDAASLWASTCSSSRLGQPSCLS